MKENIAIFVLALSFGFCVLYRPQPVEAQMSMMIGTHANLWSNATPAAGGTSAAYDTRGFPTCTVFGITSGLATITVQMSADNVNFYGGDSLTMANGEFSMYTLIGSRYMRLGTDTGVTVTATIQCKL